jgi:hypothetical protein
MDDRSAIFIDSFRESLRRVDSIITWGIGAALAVFALSVTSPGMVTEVSFGFAKFNESFGSVFVLAAYFVLGCMGIATIDHVKKVAQKLDLPTRLALKTFPSVVTWSSSKLQILAALFPAILVSAGFLYGRFQMAPSPQLMPWYKLIIGLLLFTSPYFFFAFGIAQCNALFPDDYEEAKLQN